MGAGKFIFDVGKKIVSKKNFKPKIQGYDEAKKQLAKNQKAKELRAKRAKPKKQRAKKQSFKKDPSRIAAREIGKKQADLNVPANTKNFRDIPANNPGSLTTPQSLSGTRVGVQKAVNKDRKEKKSLENKIKKIRDNIDDLKIKNKKMSAFHSQDKKGIGKTKSGKPLLAGIANNTERLKKNTEELKSLTEQTSLINTRIRDMKSKYAVKKAGGKIVARKKSGKVGTKKAGCKAGQGKAMKGF